MGRTTTKKKATPRRGRSRPRINGATGAREVVTLSPTKKVGEVNKPWFQQQPIAHESQLEKDFIHSSMVCLGIAWIESQPFTMRLSETTYTPDFRLHLKNGRRLIVEIKLDLKVSKYISVFNEAAKILLADGEHFYVVTEKDIGYLGRDYVASELIPYGKSELSRDVLNAILACAGELGPTTCEELRTRSGGQQEDVQHLLARRALVPCDEGLITPRSIVRIPTEMDPHAAFEARFNVQPWVTREPVPQKARTPRAGLKKRPPKSRLPTARVGAARQLEKSGSAVAGGLSATRPPSEEPYLIRRARDVAKRSD